MGMKNVTQDPSFMLPHGWSIVANNYSADTNGVSIDTQGISQPAPGIMAVFSLKDFTGLTSIAILLEDSADDVTFAAVSGATTGALVADQNGIIQTYLKTRRYVRAVLDVTGVGSADVAVAIFALGKDSLEV